MGKGSRVARESRDCPALVLADGENLTVRCGHHKFRNIRKGLSNIPLFCPLFLSLSHVFWATLFVPLSGS